jgi:GNAT superfamily N-acetyltransferase
MSKKQKVRNTNQFKKKKNQQKNRKKIENAFYVPIFGNPPKINVKHFEETENFKSFIAKIEKRLFDIKLGNMLVKITNGVEERQTAEMYNGRVNINETISSISVQFQSDIFFLEFTPFENGIHLYKIAVLPAYHKKGIGKILMGEIMKIADELSLEISLIPIPMGGLVPLEKLRAFYKSFGFIKKSNSHYWKYTSTSFALNGMEYYQMAA